MSDKSGVKKSFKNFIRKDDIKIAAAAIALAAVAQILCGNIFKESGSYVRVSLNGEAAASYSLNNAGEYEVTGYSGTDLRFSIESGAAKMVFSDCPDKICMKHAPISKLGESVVCLPNRVVLLITDEP